MRELTPVEELRHKARMNRLKLKEDAMIKAEREWDLCLARMTEAAEVGAPSLTLRPGTDDDGNQAKGRAAVVAMLARTALAARLEAEGFRVVGTGISIQRVFTVFL